MTEAARGAVRRPRVALRPTVLLLVVVGGCAGGLARYALTLALPGDAAGWPWGVLAANTSGAFLLGVLLVPVLALAPTNAWLRPTLGTGFCGSFTTMSALAVGVDRTVTDDGVAPAAGLLAASALAGLLAAGVGIAVGRQVVRRSAARSGGAR